MALASVIANPRAGSFADKSAYRKYAAVLSTETTLAGVPDRSDKRILYEVGIRHKTKELALAPLPDGVVTTNTSYPSGALMSELFSGLARKFSNFGGTFELSNLGGVVARIARGLAADSAYPDGVSATDLLGDRELRVHALGTYFSPVSASMETVFVPRIVDTLLTPDVFAVLAHAICGEGGIVATDLVDLDPATRAPQVPHVDEYAFATSAVDALRLLGANMSACGQGELYATALVKGLNDVLSIVGHTDEGAILRDVFRASAFGPPFGGVHTGIIEYAGLPALATGDGNVVAGYCDSLLLSAAALVAHCDPGVVFNHAWLPTVLTASRDGAPYAEAGTETAAADWMGPSNKASLTRVFGPFARQYTQALAKLFGLNAEGGPATALLECGLRNLAPTCRHLRYPVVAPFFWIEPTSLIPHDFTGFAAEVEGFASIATRHTWRELPLWESASRVGRPNEHTSNLVVRFRGARTCGLITHFGGHALDGLAHVKVVQLDPEGIMLPGPLPRSTVRETAVAGSHLGQYLWTRGQSPLPAPAELLNIGETLGLRIAHLGLSDDGYPDHKHIPRSDEILNGVVRATVSGLLGVKPGPLGEHPREARRSRTQAARSLAAAAAGHAHYQTAVEFDLPLLLSAPALGRQPLAASLAGIPATEARGPSSTVAAEAAHDANLDRYTSALPVAALMANDPDHGPKMQPSRAAIATGGVAPTDPATPGHYGGDAISDTSAAGPALAPTATTSGAAPLERAGSN